jgi:hypothetical protein
MTKQQQHDATSANLMRYRQTNYNTNDPYKGKKNYWLFANNNNSDIFIFFPPIVDVSVVDVAQQQSTTWVNDIPVVVQQAAATNSNNNNATSYNDNTGHLVSFIHINRSNAAKLKSHFSKWESK